MMTGEDKLTIRNENGRVTALPTVSLFMFSDSPLSAVMPRVADLIERFVELIAPEKLATRVDADGNERQLAPRRMSRDLTILRNPQSDQSSEQIIYESETDEWVSAYSFSFFGIEPGSKDAEPSETNMVAITFPYSTVGSKGADAIAQIFGELASTFTPLTYGYAGYSLRRTEATMGMSTRQVHALISRFIGLDPSHLSMRFSMKGRTFGAHWIDFIGRSLLAELGPRSASSAIPGADIRGLPSGTLMIRSAKAPPLGDVNRLAQDIGVVPDTARWLKPLRSRVTRLGDPNFDAQAWLARFDERKVEAWDNEP